MRKTVAAVLTIGILYGTTGAHAQTFEWSFSMRSGDRTSGVTSGDFDRDGDVDVAFAAGEHRPVPAFVYFNDGRGNFDLVQRFEGRDQRGQDMAAFDFDGDGWVDLVYITELGDRNVLFLNDGTGRFVEGWRFGDVTDNGRSVAVVDLDRDGRQDVVVANRGQPNRAFRNMGPDGLEPWFEFGDPSGATVTIVSMDFDGDGFADVAAGDWSGDTRGVHVWRNDGTGRLGSPRTYGDPDQSVSALSAGDLDGDGDIDLVVAVQQRNPEDPGAAGFEYDRWTPGGVDFVLVNDGTGQFPDQWNVGRLDDATTAVTVADLDKDGLSDLAFGFSRGESFYRYEGPGDEWWFDHVTPGYHGAIYMNRGTGSFERASEFNAHLGTVRDIVAADVNGDSFPDLIVACGGTSAAFLNSLGPPVGRWR